MEGRDLPSEVGLPDRLHIGRTILNAAQTTSQEQLPVPTDEVEYMGSKNPNAPVQSGASIASRQPLGPVTPDSYQVHHCRLAS
jgi:hypothetical protein